MTNGEGPRSSEAGSYVPVNDFEMYYGVNGIGNPLVVIHGAYVSIDAMGGVVPELDEMHGDLAGLPNSQLAVLPGTTHVGMVERSDWLLSIIGTFLDAPMPEAGRDAVGRAWRASSTWTTLRVVRTPTSSRDSTSTPASRS